MNPPVDLAIFIETDTGRLIAARQPDRRMESSSTIKLPILFLALTKATQQGHGPATTLPRQDHHASRGSGILNWTSLTEVSLSDLLTTTMVYSDCLATNMLLDYIGGQASLNAWLAKNGFLTRLHMAYLDFSEEEPVMPSVGTTTAREIAQLFKRLATTAWPEPLAGLVKYATGHVNQSWLELNSPVTLPNLHHKTGSMIGSGRSGETVLNAAGSVESAGRTAYFGLLSRGLTGPAGSATETKLKRTVAGQLALALRG